MAGLSQQSAGPGAPPGAVRLTELSHGAGCACKLDPTALHALLEELPTGSDPALLVGSSSADDAAVYRVADDLAIISTVDFFTPIVDDPFDFGRIAATNALSDVYAMGGRPVMALNLVAFSLEELGSDTLRTVLAGGQSVAPPQRPPGRGARGRFGHARGGARRPGARRPRGPGGPRPAFLGTRARRAGRPRGRPLPPPGQRNDRLRARRAGHLAQVRPGGARAPGPDTGHPSRRGCACAAPAHEQRRNRTFQAGGFPALPVLKTGWATRPVPLRSDANSPGSEVS